ncbi:DUF5709 domain-containing protein [Streptomyces termitum]|uniref:DUF5709 domain-containing protein n=1 Tax=Streptomyces termitum TaxID=67368 RepID=UPI0037AC34BD
MTTPENTPDAEGTPGGRGDDVYQPPATGGADRPDDPLDPDNALDTRATEEAGEPGYSPPERLRAADRHGTTGREAREGAPIDERLAEERPDTAPPDPADDGVGDRPGAEGEPVDDEAGARRAGRLVRPEDGTAGGTTATDVGPDDGTAPAEEAAVHRDTAVDAPEEDV